MKKRFLRMSAAIVAFSAGLAGTASAATLLDTFQQKMQEEGSADSFAYDSVISDTDTSFEIAGVRITPDDSSSIITIDRLKVDAIDTAAMDSDGMPEFMTMSAEGFHLPTEEMDADSREMFPDGITFDFGIDYSTDKANNALDLRELSLAMDGYGSIAVSLAMTGVTDETLAGMAMMGPEALMGGGDVTLDRFSITLDDDGGLALLMQMIAEEQGMDADSFVNMALLPQMQMMGGMFAADPIGAAVVNALSGFIGDYASPAGPLTISADPPSPVNLMSLMSLGDPTTLPAMLGLSATYEGGH